MLQQTTIERINNIFDDADVSLIAEVIYFDSWSTHEEYGGYLIFKAIDGSYQLAEYGYCVFQEEYSNPFDLEEISWDLAKNLISEMDKTIKENEEWMEACGGV